MNRRGFIGSLLATAVIDPEKLLWVPGKKHISIPNRILHPGDWFTVSYVGYVTDIKVGDLISFDRVVRDFYLPLRITGESSMLFSASNRELHVWVEA